MKKFINAVDKVEDQMIQGMVKAYPQYVKKLDCGNVVVRPDTDDRPETLSPPKFAAPLHETLPAPSVLPIY